MIYRNKVKKVQEKIMKFFEEFNVRYQTDNINVPSIDKCQAVLQTDNCNRPFLSFEEKES